MPTAESDKCHLDRTLHVLRKKFNGSASRHLPSAYFNDKDPGFRRGLCDPAGIRTQGPYIKSVLLYQLSYRIENALHNRVLRFEARR